MKQIQKSMYQPCLDWSDCPHILYIHITYKSQSGHDDHHEIHEIMKQIHKSIKSTY